jgi:hypothetical protein
MRRILLTSVLTAACLIAGASDAHAQVFVRAPFVRVQVGPGVWVRAPFVNLFFPSAAPIYTYPPGYPVPTSPATEVLPQPGLAPNPATAQDQKVVMPAPGQPPQPMSLDQFAKTFQAKAGSYDVDLINPVTNQPTKVRFSLPEGAPRNVHVRPNEIEFRYGLLRFVRIEFDKDGAQVVSR